MESIVKIKSTIPKQLPGFIEEDHPIFVKFVEAYFEYIEQQNGPVSFVRNALNYVDPSVTMDAFITNFFEEMKDIPQDVLANKQLLAMHIYELFQAKGTMKGYELLFRIMFNEDIEVYLPKFDLLRPSDGKWERDLIIRVTPGVGDPFTLIGQEIYQLDEFGNKSARARVDNVIYLDDKSVYDLYISKATIIGEFANLEILCNGVTVTPMPSPKFTPKLTRGSGYKLGDRIVSYNSPEVDAIVSSIKSGPITKVFVLDGGTGHSVGDQFVINSTVGFGADLRVEAVDNGKVTKVKVVSGGQGYEAFQQLQLDGNGCFVAVGPTIGSILDVTVRDPGVNHQTPPTCSVNTLAVITNPTSAFLSGETIEPLPSSLLTEDYNGFVQEDSSVFLTEEQVNETIDYTISNVTCNTAVFNGFFGSVELNQEDDSILLLETGGTFVGETSNGSIANRTVRGITSSAITRVVYINPVDLDSTLHIIHDTGARFINDDGKLSEITKRIQDSRYYQEFSYVIKSSHSIQDYKSTIYKLMHPAGMVMFGAINIETKISLIVKAVTEYASIVIKILELYFDQSKSARFVLDLTSIVSLDQSKMRDYRWLEQNKFYFGPQFGEYGGYVEQAYLLTDTNSVVGANLPKLSSMRDVSGIQNEVYNYNTLMNIMGNIRFDEFYEYDIDSYSYVLPGYVDPGFLFDDGVVYRPYEYNGAVSYDGSIHYSAEYQLFSGQYFPRNTKTRFTWESEITIS